MKRILVNGETVETYRMLDHYGKTIKDFKIHYKGPWYRRHEVLVLFFTDDTSMTVE